MKRREILMSNNPRKRRISKSVRAMMSIKKKTMINSRSKKRTMAVMSMSKTTTSPTKTSKTTSRSKSTLRMRMRSTARRRRGTTTRWEVAPSAWLNGTTMMMKLRLMVNRPWSKRYVYDCHLSLEVSWCWCWWW